MSMFDMSKVEVIEGKIAKLDWTNPHMYLTVETKGPDGKPALIEGEGLGITQAAVDGLKREDLKRGTPVVVRINPNRSGWGKQVRILDVTTQDGEIHPFYAANTRTRVLTPATSIADPSQSMRRRTRRTGSSRSTKTVTSAATKMSGRLR